MSARHELGRRGEELAACYLQAEGWEILDRNWRAGHAEMDLVVRREGVVAFVEVKTRAGDGCGDPLESITPWKRREVERAARAWLRVRGRMLEGRHVFRFDAVGVTVTRGRPPDVRHVADAWHAGDSG